MALAIDSDNHVSAVGKPADVGCGHAVREGNGMGFTGVDLTEKEAVIVRVGQVTPITRDRRGSNRIIYRICRQASDSRG